MVNKYVGKYIDSQLYGRQICSKNIQVVNYKVDKYVGKYISSQL